MIRGSQEGKVYAQAVVGKVFPLLVWDRVRYVWHLWYCVDAPEDGDRVMASAVGPLAPFCNHCRIR